MHTSSWLSFNTLQTWSTDYSNYEMVQVDYGKRPVKVAVNGEARYEEEDGTTPFQARRAGYWACLAGGFYSYGHRDNWNSPPTWKQWYNSPGARQVKIMGDIFRSIEWWELIPDQSLFETSIKGNAAARSAKGDWILAYITNPAPVSVKLSKLTSGKTAQAFWIDPLTGKRDKIGTYSISEAHSFSLPKGWEDGVLLIK
jgi:hypothetical protein